MHAECLAICEPRTKSELSEFEALAVKLIPHKKIELKKVPSKVKELKKP